MFTAYIQSGAATVAQGQSALQTSSDEALVARIAEGDKLAMQVLFARHRTPVYRWLLRFVGNETVAEDLLSDVFLDVWRQAGRFEGRAAVSTWLLSIARFKALSARRRRTDAQLDEAIETTVVDSADDPEVALQKKSRNELLRQANLSPEHREIIDLVREAIIEAAVQHGDDGRGRDGLIGCCKYICRENPGAFAGLLAKVLPAQARLQHDKTVTVALEDLKLVAKEMKELGLSSERLLGKHVDW